MGALLYRWSTAAQLVSVLMIALFYATLARSLRRAELTWWARSWWSDFVAMAVTASYWFFTPTNVAGPLLRAAYVSSKAVYAVLLVQGARAMCRPGTQWLGRRTLYAVGAVSLLVGLTMLPTIDSIGIVVQGGLGILFLWAASSLFAARVPATMWLAAGFLARGALSIVEAVAYGMDMLPAGVLDSSVAAGTQVFLGAHSSIDLGAEWLLALGGVLAITQRSQLELETANTDLLTVQAQLRNLADRDPLTGLANRRTLQETFRKVFMSGASILFLDLDGFKKINDTFGHAAGDACLTHFSAALRSSFRPSDSIIRYAGDEFVVVAPAMTVDMAEQRLAHMRERLARPDENGVVISFSAGIAVMEPGGDAEAALHTADEAMYDAKKLRQG